LAKIVEFQKIAEVVGDCFGKINLLVPVTLQPTMELTKNFII
jgi:hypothetical protein